ncbi:MAG: putative membrane protein [Promethearchaeota archaeon]|nr:MAG: putative membrane protein [Candidatus Lokiarchaeota archaeon]
MKIKMEKSESEYVSEDRTIFGYFLPLNTLNISLIAIFSALICVLTFFIVIPVPVTQGFINIGDAGVMIAGILFGPIIGGFAGGIGSMLGDIILGYNLYAPGTLVIKGLEGFLVGLIADPKRSIKKVDFRDVAGVVIGGLIMVFGYLVYEIFIFGVPAALYEFFLNGLIQFTIGVSVSLLFAFSIRKNLFEALPQVFKKVFIEKSPSD